MKIRTIGAVAALALSLTACGGGDDEQASKALSDSIMESNDQTFEVTREQADCLGDGMVEEIGTDQLVEYGIITEELEAADGIEGVEMSQGDAESAADVMSGCADIKELFTGAMGDNIPAEAQACIDENLTDEVLNKFLVAVFQNDMEGGQQEMITALGECIQPGS